MSADLSKAISPATYKRLEMLWSNRTLPIRATRTLLEIWVQDKPACLKAMDESNSLLPLLTSYAPALNRAADLAAEMPHLSEAERLELAGLPLKVPAD